MTNRRNFLGLATLAPFIKIPNLFKEKELKVPILGTCEITFHDGDKVVLNLAKKDNAEGFYCVSNSLGHTNFDVKTEFDLEPIFYGRHPNEVKMTIIYTAFDKDGKIIYTNTGSKKVWTATP